jgi:hypothetical protein
MGACATGVGAVRTGTGGTALRGAAGGSTGAGATTRGAGAGAGATGRAATGGRGAAGRADAGCAAGVALERYCGSATAVADAYEEGGAATGISGATGSLFLPSFFRNPNIGGRGLIAQFFTK